MIVDLTVVWAEADDDGAPYAREVIVTPLAGHVPRARQALLDWATAVGYERLWLPGEVVDLELAPPCSARGSCSACRMRWDEIGDADFWVSVLRRGRFPSFCVLCGGDVPQWTVTPTAQPVVIGPPLGAGNRQGASR